MDQSEHQLHLLIGGMSPEQIDRYLYDPELGDRITCHLAYCTLPSCARVAMECDMRVAEKMAAEEAALSPRERLIRAFSNAETVYIYRERGIIK